jgi:hypothetical protein
MEQPVASSKQRSPWLYVLLGCGAFAALMCLGATLVAVFIGKTVKNVSDGITDPGERTSNAVAQLGAIPEGYNVVASLSVFGLMKTTVLTTQRRLDDGGFEPSADSRTFTYFRIPANDNTQRAKDFLMGKDVDASALAQSGVNIKPGAIVKRGQLQVAGRRHFYVASRGRLDTGAVEPVDALMVSVLFDCPSDALQLGVWQQLDPASGQPIEALELGGTVADEEELARFLNPLTPCGR